MFRDASLANGKQTVAFQVVSDQWTLQKEIIARSGSLSCCGIVLWILSDIKTLTETISRKVETHCRWQKKECYCCCVFHSVIYLANEVWRKKCERKQRRWAKKMREKPENLFMREGESWVSQRCDEYCLHAHNLLPIIFWAGYSDSY